MRNPHLRLSPDCRSLRLRLVLQGQRQGLALSGVMASAANLRSQTFKYIPKRVQFPGVLRT